MRNRNVDLARRAGAGELRVVADISSAAGVGLKDLPLHQVHMTRLPVFVVRLLGALHRCKLGQVVRDRISGLFSVNNLQELILLQ